MTGDVGQVLGALADETRRGIVAMLASGATPTATELAAGLPMSRQAVAKHLRVLEDAKVVRVQRAGRETRYHLTTEALGEAADWIAEISSAWDRRLSRLKAEAEADRDRDA